TAVPARTAARDRAAADHRPGYPDVHSSTDGLSYSMPNSYRKLALVLIAASSMGAVSMMNPRETVPDAATAPALGTVYAAPVERVETHVLGSGQTLSGVLAQASITGQEMADLLLGLRGYLNPRSVAAGAEVTIRRWLRNDEPRAIEVRVNPDST